MPRKPREATEVPPTRPGASSTDDERGLREVLTRGSLDPDPSHELAAEVLHRSRSAYVRRLRTATERLAEHLSG